MDYAALQSDLAQLLGNHWCGFGAKVHNQHLRIVYRPPGKALDLLLLHGRFPPDSA
jgi:hypothetical protein